MWSLPLDSFSFSSKPRVIQFKLFVLAFALSACFFLSTAQAATTDTEIKTIDPATGAENEGSVKSSKNPITGTKTLVKKSKVKKKLPTGEPAQIDRTEKVQTSKQGNKKTTITEEEKKDT